MQTYDQDALEVKVDVREVTPEFEIQHSSLPSALSGQRSHGDANVVTDVMTLVEERAEPRRTQLAERMGGQWQHEDA